MKGIWFDFVDGHFLAFKDQTLYHLPFRLNNDYKNIELYSELEWYLSIELRFYFGDALVPLNNLCKILLNLD